MKTEHLARRYVGEQSQVTRLTERLHAAQRSAERAQHRREAISDQIDNLTDAEEEAFWAVVDTLPTLPSESRN